MSLQCARWIYNPLKGYRDMIRTNWWSFKSKYRNSLFTVTVQLESPIPLGERRRRELKNCPKWLTTTVHWKKYRTSAEGPSGKFDKIWIPNSSPLPPKKSDKNIITEFSWSRWPQISAQKGRISAFRRKKKTIPVDQCILWEIWPGYGVEYFLSFH